MRINEISTRKVIRRVPDAYWVLNKFYLDVRLYVKIELGTHSSVTWEREECFLFTADSPEHTVNNSLLNE